MLNIDWTTAFEDGGIGALLVALIWAFVHWWGKRTQQPGR